MWLESDIKCSFKLSAAKNHAPIRPKAFGATMSVSSNGVPTSPQPKKVSATREGRRDSVGVRAHPSAAFCTRGRGRAADSGLVSDLDPTLVTQAREGHVCRVAIGSGWVNVGRGSGEPQATERSPAHTHLHSPQTTDPPRYDRL